MSDNLFIFKPTILIVKQHNKTGKLYFHKTTRLNLVETYSGSGKYWKKHLKKHGNDWTNIWISDVFNNKDDLTEFALFFSEFFDVVKSREWANEIPENGLDGGENPYSHSTQAKAKRIKTLKENNIRWSLSPEAKQKHRDVMTAYWNSPKGLEKRAKEFILIGPPKPPSWFLNNNRKYQCPHCPKSGDLRNMKRWHFNNCKSIPQS